MAKLIFVVFIACLTVGVMASPAKKDKQHELNTKTPKMAEHEADETGVSRFKRAGLKKKLAESSVALPVHRFKRSFYPAEQTPYLDGVPVGDFDDGEYQRSRRRYSHYRSYRPSRTSNSIARYYGKRSMEPEVDEVPYEVVEVPDNPSEQLILIPETPEEARQLEMMEELQQQEMEEEEALRRERINLLAEELAENEY